MPWFKKENPLIDWNTGLVEWRTLFSSTIDYETDSNQDNELLIAFIRGKPELEININSVS